MKRDAKGFTLVELLVAISVMAVAFAGIASMGVSTMKADTRGRQVTEATALAQAKLEELRVLRRSDADWAAGSHSEVGLDSGGSIGGGPYTREWEVEENYNGFNNLSRVTVTVSWYDGEVSFASLYWR
ncbi:MAG: type II secretion system protein [Thermodesulfobacteriota bacterium]|jgi:prepilin-type N-terminal cleavage/methylation domain-containing protein